MITIRKYKNTDSVEVGKLIADTFKNYNLSHASEKNQQKLLGPFRNARSKKEVHKNEIAEILLAPIMFVAINNRNKIIGVLRGSTDKLRSLFVDGKSHRQGIGHKLVRRFEKECVKQNGSTIKLMSTIYAIPFYLQMGYKKSTGVRKMNVFDGTGLEYQPMRKIL